MSDSSREGLRSRKNSSKARLLVLGGCLGALTGMGIAFVLAQRADRQGGEVSLSTGEGLRLGLLMLGMLREVADLALPDEEE